MKFPRCCVYCKYSRELFVAEVDIKEDLFLKYLEDYCLCVFMPDFRFRVVRCSGFCDNYSI